MSSVTRSIRRPRAAYYERVSTDESARRDTIANQDKKLHKSYDWHFDEDAREPWDFMGTFRDNAVSGTIPLDARPDGARLMSLVRRGEVDIVCVAYSDRLARERAVAEAIADEFAGREIVIKSPSEHIDLTTPAGRLQFAIMCAFAHFEREQIRIRTMNGRMNHAERGDWINGPVPFGYVVEKCNDSWQLAKSERTIEELGIKEFELVEQIFTRCAAGESLLSVMRWLQAAGVPSIKRYFSKKSGVYTEKIYPKWQYSKLQDIVENTTYYGERKLNYHTVESNKYKQTPAPVVQLVPAIVTRALFDEAKLKRSKHAANWATSRDDEYTYLLTGKILCGGCNAHMRGNYQKQSAARRKAKFYYVCNRRKGNTEHLRLGVPCAYVKSIQGNYVEEQILQEFDKIASAPDAILAKLRQQQFEQHGSIGSQNSRKLALQKRLVGLERGRTNLLKSLSDGDVSPEEFRTQSANNALAAAESRRELEMLESEDTLAEALVSQIRDAEAAIKILVEQWPEVRAAGDRAKIRAFIQPLIQRVVVHPDRIEASILTIVSHQTHDKAHLLNYVQVVSPLSLDWQFAPTTVLSSGLSLDLVEEA